MDGSTRDLVDSFKFDFNDPQGSATKRISSTGLRGVADKSRYVFD